MKCSTRSSDCATAVTPVSQALEAGADEPQIRFERGQARARLGDHGDAIDDFTQALVANPGLVVSGVRMMRGKSRFEAGEIEQAEEDFAAEVARNPDQPAPLIWQIRTLSDLGEYTAAEAAARKLLEIEPESARARAALGDVLLRAGNIAEGHWTVLFVKRFHGFLLSVIYWRHLQRPPNATSRRCRPKPELDRWRHKLARTGTFQEIGSLAALDVRFVSPWSVKPQSRCTAAVSKGDVRMFWVGD